MPATESTGGDATVSTRSILLVDDDAQELDLLTRLFSRQGWVVHTASTGAAALQCHAAEHASLVLLDFELPDLNGLDVLRLLRDADPEIVVVMLTGAGTIELAVQAIQLGAENFLVKPYGLAQLTAVIERAHEKVMLRKQAYQLWQQQLEQRGVMVGGSPTSQDLVRQLQTLAQADTTVLLQGETGTGKGWVAQLLHTLSPRVRAPFVEVNCAGLTSTFLDAELFGHERGAFTDAKTQKSGLFEVAHRGTLFLDEIGDMAPELQPKLLKALEDRRFRRIGGTREIEVDVRLISATNRDLPAAVRESRFRDDLFYRIAVATVRLPPLRERGRSEIAALAAGFLAELARRFQRSAIQLDPETLELLARHSWPGNIRELKNVLEQAMLVLGASDVIKPEHLPRDLRIQPEFRAAAGDDQLPLDELERRHIERVLRSTGGNRSQAARILGISRVGLYKKLQRLEQDDDIGGTEPAADDERC